MNLKTIQEVVISKLQVSNCKKLYLYDLNILVEAIVTYFYGYISKGTDLYNEFFEDPNCELIYQACVYYICYHTILERLAQKIAKDIDKIKPRIFVADITVLQCHKDSIWDSMPVRYYFTDFDRLEWKNTVYFIVPEVTAEECTKANSNFLPVFLEWVKKYNCDISKISFKIIYGPTNKVYKAFAADIYSGIQDNIMK